MADPPIPLSEFPDRDDVFDALANERRRRIIEILHDAEQPLPLADVARAIERQEIDESVDQVDDPVRAIHVELYHVHVPKLDEAGLVEHSPNAGTLTLSPDLHHETTD